MIGQNIGHYHIISELGRGGMGQVYEARDTQLGRPVALKFMRRDVTLDSISVGRFIREARAASALNHPNIVTIYEIGETEAGRFIAMELIRGKTLRAIAEQPVQVDSIREIGGQIAEALAVAHASGIVHRDIKPENIMLRDDGYVKVLDFGLALLNSSNKLDSMFETLTAGSAAGALIGTLRYMSPEQLRGEPIANATDVFSLGIVLYEFVTGRHPFQTSSAASVINAILTQKPISPARLRAELPAFLDSLILRMLSKEAPLRPTSKEVANMLRAPAAAKRLPRTLALQPEQRHSVGREKEHQDLREAFDTVSQGRGLLACVSGEPGIGKTTLVEDFLTDLTAAGLDHIVARGRSSERLAGAEAYLPFLEALENLMRTDSAGSIARMMKMLAPTWYTQVVPLNLDDSSVAHMLADVEAGSQERLKRELNAFLQEVCRLAPLVLFFDDLHWMNVSSVDLLSYLATKFETLRIFIVVTYRPTELLLGKHPFLHIKTDLQARRSCRDIALEFLTCEDTRNYLSLEFPEHRFPANFPAIVHAKTEGNPLFMTDLLRYLRDRKVIVQEKGVWSLVESVPNVERDLPESVRGMIQRKIGQVDEADTRLLAAASVQGSEFDSAVIAQALGLDPAYVEERVEVLDRVHGLVCPMREQEFPDRTLTLRCRFVHVLYQDAIYSSITLTRKGTLSSSIARALLGHYRDEGSAIASELALLFEAARDFSNAADYFLRAAQNSARIFAHKEAVLLARRGLQMLKNLPDTPERRSRELGLMISLTVPLLATRGYADAEVEAVYMRTRELCLEINDRARLFTVLRNLARCHLARLEVDTSRRFADELQQLSKENPQLAVLVQAQLALGSTSYYFGNFAVAREELNRCIALCDAEQQAVHVQLYASDPRVDSRCILALALWSLGYPDLAHRSIEEALALARQLKNTYTLVYALYFGSVVHLRRHDLKKTQELAEMLFSLATEHSLRHWVPLATFLRGWVLAQQGYTSDGTNLMVGAITTYRAMGARSSVPHLLGLLAAELGEQGNVQEGLKIVEEALAATSGGGHYDDAELHRIKGQLLLAKSDATEDQGERSFQTALNVARSQSAKSFELRAVMSLSRLWHRQGLHQQARQILQTTYAWFSEGFETGDLIEARTQLQELSSLPGAGDTI